VNNEGKSIWDDLKSWFECLFEGHSHSIDARLGRIEKHISKLTRKVTQMSVSVDKVLADIQTLVAGSQAKDALIKQLQDALAAADATQAQAVADAVAADESGIQAQIDAADAVAQEYLNPAPADGGGAPVDGGSGDAPSA
jgi:chromosome segregation ATPase